MKRPASQKRRASGEGERIARRGYVHQDSAAARLIYNGLLDRTLHWIGLADRGAGTFDDLVLGSGGAVVAHQFKRAMAPSPQGLTALLLGKGNGIANLAAAYSDLRAQFPDVRLRLRYLDNNPPATGDRLVRGNALSSSAAFLDAMRRHPDRAPPDWAQTPWASVFGRLGKASGLDAAAFVDFWASLELVLGEDAAAVLVPGADPAREAQIEELGERLGGLIAGNPSKDRWTREELLDALGWRVESGRIHAFPLAPHVQGNTATEGRMAAALANADSGYIALLGSPGSGKSTFLQREIRPAPGRHVLRYLAFVPGLAQGQGRGEADSFFDDINRQLGEAGLERLRLRDPTRHLRQQEFEHLLARAGDAFEREGTEFVIVIDGLDHVPREECPRDSFLGVLPLPQSVPRGIRIVLGSQRLNDLGLPPQVEAQAGAAGRRIDIAPLSRAAHAALADAMALSAEVDRQSLFEATRGHPLVARYLIGLLAAADPAQRETILAEGFEFAGDIEAIYEAAWRSAGSQGDDSVQRVLVLLGWLDGAIEPALLATALGTPAVDSAYRQARHLLQIAGGRWSVFHNSFRLFLRRKRIERFGQPDPDLNGEAVYRRLADLAATAPETSPQRWLEFRYALLGEDETRARALATRAYFVRQYIEGRSAAAVRGDIRQAYRLYADLPDGAPGLFGLMLASDEIWRRSQVMEGVESLIDALLAIGDYDGALAALDEPRLVGKEWLVVDSLRDAGLTERARALFDECDPEDALRGLSPPLRGHKLEELHAWVARAVVFLDDVQLRRRLDRLIEGIGEAAENPLSDLNAVRADLNFEIARAIIAERSDSDVDAIAADWAADRDMPRLLIEAAARRGPADGSLVIHYLSRAAGHSSCPSLHPNWLGLAARVSLDVGDDALARQFAAHLPVVGLVAIDPPGQIEQAGPAARALATAVSLHARLGMDLPALDDPKERLLQGAQHHVVALAEAAGLALARPLPLSEVERRIGQALRFVLLGRTERGDDWAVSHMIGALNEVLLDLVFTLVSRTPSSTLDVAAIHEALMAGVAVGFGHGTIIRRRIALAQFERDGDEDAVRRRLEGIAAAISESDPREHIEEQVQSALAFARIGDRMRAREILAELRRHALGTWLAAKKDGQYELWMTVLANANLSAPEGREARARHALRLVDGLMRTQGYDTGGRIARQVLFEAASIDAGLAWQAMQWAARYGHISWDGIVDAALRGLVARNPIAAPAALQVWVHLSLPWYQEPHGSTVARGRFLTDLFATARQAQLESLTQVALDGIVRFARADTRAGLLDVLRNALAQRGCGTDTVERELSRWRAATPPRDKRRSDHDYREIVTLPGIDAQIVADTAQAAAEPEDYQVQSPDWALRRRLREIVPERPWTEVQAFFRSRPDLLDNCDIGLIVARRAATAGETGFVTEILRAMRPRDTDGWTFDSGKGRRAVHEVRHLLGEADAFDVARREFVDDLATGQIGSSTILWELEDVFPVIYYDIPWPALWDELLPQIEATRDYQVGEFLPDPQGAGGGALAPEAKSGSAVEAGPGFEIDPALQVAATDKHDPDLSQQPVGASACADLNDGADPGGGEVAAANDDALIEKLLHWAIRLGAIALEAMAGDALAVLAGQGEPGHAVRLANRLLAGERDDPRRGIAIVCRLSTHPEMEAAFAPRLVQLLDHADLAVAAAAAYLGALWRVPLRLAKRPLPTLYRLALPEDGEGPLRSGDSRHRLDDPFSLLTAWSDLVELLSEEGGVSEGHVRHRVMQILSGWPETRRFADRSAPINAQLARLDLKLVYIRPEGEDVQRAFRIAAAELWRAGQIAPPRLRFLCNRLRVDPEWPPVPPLRSRAEHLALPPVPDIPLHKEATEWLGSTGEEVSADRLSREPDVLTQYWRHAAASHGRASIAEHWSAPGGAGATDNLDEWLETLPRALWLGKVVPLYGPDEIHPSCCAWLVARRLDPEAPSILIFCPLVAARLGWLADAKEIGRYEDSGGAEMAHSVRWIEGVAQSKGDRERRAEGQRVMLSGGGLAALRRLDVAEIRDRHWRRIEDDQKGNRSSTAQSGEGAPAPPDGRS